MDEKKSTEISLMEHVQKILVYKRAREELSEKQKFHYQKFKLYLGKVQQESRNINKEMEEFEQFRIADFKLKE